MAQNYGPGSPYPTTETGKRMAAAGIPIFAGGQDPSVYMQSGENAVVGRPATFTGAPGSEAGMTPEMLAKLKASMGGQVPSGPDFEFMPAPGMSSEGVPPVMSETMPPGGGGMQGRINPYVTGIPAGPGSGEMYSPDMNPRMVPPSGPPGGGGVPSMTGEPIPIQWPIGPPMQPPGGGFQPMPILPPQGPPQMPGSGPIMAPQPPGGLGPKKLPTKGAPPFNPRTLPPGRGGPRQVPNVNRLKRQYAKRYGLPPGAFGGMQGGLFGSPFGGSSYPKPRGPRKNVTGPRRVAF